MVDSNFALLGSQAEIKAAKKLKNLAVPKLIMSNSTLTNLARWNADFQKFEQMLKIFLYSVRLASIKS